MRRYIVEGRRLLEKATNMETKRKHCWGVVVENMLHNAEVVVHYEIMNCYVPCIWIQVDWYHLCNTNQRTTGVLFSWHDLERKYTAGNGWFMQGITIFWDCVGGRGLIGVTDDMIRAIREDECLLASV